MELPPAHLRSAQRSFLQRIRPNDQRRDPRAPATGSGIATTTVPSTDDVIAVRTTYETLLHTHSVDHVLARFDGFTIDESLLEDLILDLDGNPLGDPLVGAQG